MRKDLQERDDPRIRKGDKHDKFVTLSIIALFVFGVYLIWDGSPSQRLDLDEPLVDFSQSFDIEKTVQEKLKSVERMTLQAEGLSDPSESAPLENFATAGEYKARNAQIYSQFLSSNRDTHTYLPQMERLLQAGLPMLGRNHVFIGDTYFHLGDMYRANGQLMKGEQSFLTAIEIYIEVFGSEHQYIGMAHSNLGHITFQMSRFRDANTHYQKAHDMLTKLGYGNKRDLDMLKRMASESQISAEKAGL